ncbi:MAG TPA: hypothetical protein VLL52_14790 [Anaerolineae bacterium]|nr:hypothetical protein [Anaerolineae bacterium]
MLRMKRQKKQNIAVIGVLVLFLFIVGVWLEQEEREKPVARLNRGFMEEVQGQKLVLEGVMRQGEVAESFGEGQTLQVCGEETMQVFDGCNEWLYDGGEQSASNPVRDDLFWHYEHLSVLQGCEEGGDGSAQFSLALETVYDYEIKDEQYWLYYGEQDRGQALIFEEVGEASCEGD